MEGVIIGFAGMVAMNLVMMFLFFRAIWQRDDARMDAHLRKGEVGLYRDIALAQQKSIKYLQNELYQRAS